MNKQKSRVKHIPQRTCVGCRETLSKRGLMRIVCTPDGVRYDATGKAEGRGAYLHDKKSCWERALRGSLAHALKTELTQADRDYIAQIISELKDDE